MAKFVLVLAVTYRQPLTICAKDILDYDDGDVERLFQQWEVSLSALTD